MIDATFLFLFCLLTLITVSAQTPLSQPQARQRSLPRRQENATALTGRGLVARGAPLGWSIYVAAGNDGGGCYVDRSPRILPDYSTGIASSSVEAGLKICQDKGYTYAGLQNSNEVYCSRSAPTVIQNAPSGQCSSRCNSGEICGGGWRMNIYSFTDRSSATWSSQGCYADTGARVLSGYRMVDGAMTAAKCQATCASKGFKIAGVENYSECYCDNSLSAQKISDQSCSSRCNDGSSCGGAWALSIYQLSTPAPWNYVSCLTDGGPRALAGIQIAASDMTTSKCTAFCASKGFALAGTQHYSECYCANTVTRANGQGQQTAEGECNTPCGGDQSSKCGGAYRLSLYSTLTGSALTSALGGAPVTSPSAWKYVSCLSDGGAARALGGFSTSASDMTNSKCTALCLSKGFALAGTQYFSQCFCANTVTRSGGGGQQAGEGECNSVCGGDQSSKCGGGYRLSLYTTLTGSALSSALGGSAPAATTTAPVATTAPTTAAPPPTTAAPAPPPQSYTIPTNFPGGGSNGNKQIYAHLIVGNTYPYNLNTWRTDIGRAQSAGIDGFMLNIGPDSWQPARVSDAYTAAQEKGFKMVLSFDMYEFDCGGWNRVGLFQEYLQKYINHAAAGKYNGRSILTTFAGESCSFGQGNTNAGWNAVMGQWKNSIYFAPAYNVDPQSLRGYELGAEVNWGSAWPVAGKEIETSRDLWFMQQLGGRGYIGTVSPLFAAHIPGKNYIWRGDNFLFGARWDQLLSMRDRTDIVQVVSWNDYGESTYINEITGDMPQSVKDAGYVTSDFTHSALLSLQAFYSAAWKIGAYPAIAKDQIWAMARPHQAWAGAGGDAPQRREVTNDNLYVQIHLRAPANVILCSGGCSTQQGKAGINRFSQPLQVGQTASARIERNGQVVARVDSKVGFASSSPRYNFNYWILTSG